jgi:nucleoside-diphosphate-sugar epimerase
MVLTANRNSGMLTASVRPGALYGPRDNMMSTDVTKSVLGGHAKIRFGTGEYLYDTCYVENCVDAQLLIVNALLKAGPSPPLPASKKIGRRSFLRYERRAYPFLACAEARC